MTQNTKQKDPLLDGLAEVPESTADDDPGQGGYNAERPWDRQPCDTDRTWFWFRRWLTSWPRIKLGDLAAEMGVGYSTAYAFAANGMWRARALAYDNWRTRAEDEAKVTAVVEVFQETLYEMNRRHSAVLRDMLELCHLEVDKYLKAARAGQMHGLLRPHEISRMVEVSIKLERLIRGEATERQEEVLDLSALSTEQLRTLRELQRKARKDAPQLGPGED